MDTARLLSSRPVQESQIRRVFEGARDIPNPINLSIGQPDFPVPDSIKQAAIRAIQQDHNGYSNNRGIDPLLTRIAAHLKDDVGWDVPLVSSPNTPSAHPQPTGRETSAPGLMVTQGTSGALIAAAMALLDPGDELIIPDPYFVLYPRLGELTGAKT